MHFLKTDSTPTVKRNNPIIQQPKHFSETIGIVIGKILHKLTRLETKVAFLINWSYPNVCLQLSDAPRKRHMDRLEVFVIFFYYLLFLI